MYSAGQQVNCNDLNYTERQFQACTNDVEGDPCDDFHTLTGIEYSRLNAQERAQYNEEASVCLSSVDASTASLAEILVLGYHDEDGQSMVSVPDWTRGLIVPLMCSPQLSEEELFQCQNNVNDAYSTNWSRVPENLRAIFDGFVTTMTELLVTSCNLRLLQTNIEENDHPQPFEQAFAQCMYQAATGAVIDLFGTETPIAMWGVSMTYPDFFTQLASKLSGQSIESPQTQPDPICSETHDSGYWATHPLEMERYRHCPHDDSAPNEPPPPDDCPSRHSSVYWETHQEEYQRFIECHENDNNSEPLPCCSTSGTTVIETGHCNPEC